MDLRTILSCALCWVCASLPAAAHDNVEPRRIALIVGANAAAPGRKSLRYAHSDAEAVSKVLTELGGFSAEDVVVLRDPAPPMVLAVLDGQLAKLRASGQEALFVFYYSGHADASALYPHGEPLLLTDLRTRLSDPRVSVRIGVIDACRGGGWTGAKGLTETAPFEVDMPSALASEGSVLIASSSGLEDAHESEGLGASFFTHHWVGGLRGAADRNGDGEITLTEAFDYARTLTIRDTAMHSVTPQHPSFAMQLRGRHDLAISSLQLASAQIAVDPREGPVELVHLDTGIVVLEVPKGDRPIHLAVAAGHYLLRRRKGADTWARELEVAPGQTVRIEEEHLSLVGHGALAVKHAAPRPITLSTLPRGMQEMTGSLGVQHDALTDGLVFNPTEGAQTSLLAPRGLTDRWQLMLPSIAVVYRAGEQGGREWLPWAGNRGIGLGGRNGAGLELSAFPGFGVDLRQWTSARSSFDFGASFQSHLLWLSRDPPGDAYVPRQIPGAPQGVVTFTETSNPPNWFRPNTWRLALMAGYTHTLADVVTLHLAVAASQNQIFEGGSAYHRAHSREGDLVISVGSVQTVGLRPQPLVRIHLRDWLALNFESSAHFSIARRSVRQTYVVGLSFIW